MASSSSSSSSSVTAASLLSFCLCLIFITSSISIAFDTCDVVVSPLSPCFGALALKKGRVDEVLTKMCCDGAELVAKVHATHWGQLGTCYCLKELFDKNKMVVSEDVRVVLSKCGKQVVFTVPNKNSSCLIEPANKSATLWT